MLSSKSWRGVGPYVCSNDSRTKIVSTYVLTLYEQSWCNDICWGSSTPVINSSKGTKKKRAWSNEMYQQPQIENNMALLKDVKCKYVKKYKWRWFHLI